MPEADLEGAIRAWRAILGEDAVHTQEDARAVYARSTMSASRMPSCVLYPTTAQQAAAILQAASEFHAPVHPISKGKNWGYGDACPARDDVAIVDLGRMNRILEIDPVLGYAVIEPGVTQGQLYEAVREQAPGFWMDATGAGPDASIVGNILERGFGHTPYGDHVRTTCGFEVALPNGELMRTGMHHFEGARGAPVFPYGLGPMIDGLFSQCGLGIVTKAWVWLCPKPQAFRFFWLKVMDEDALVPLIEKLRPLRMSGVLNSAVHIGNDLRVLSATRAYPWDRTNNTTPLPSELRRTLRREGGMGAWNVSGSLTGTDAQVAGAARALRSAMGGMAKVYFLNDRRIALVQRAAALAGRVGKGAVLRRQVAALVPNYGLLKGIPTTHPLISTQWRLRNASGTPEDPRDSSSGLMWLAPILPIRGTDAHDLVTGLEAIFSDHGFDMPLSLTLLNERSMTAVINISYDQSVAGEGDAAQACYDAAMTFCREEGFVPYRTSLQGSVKYFDADDPYWQTVLRIKRALDPQGIVSPGKFLPEDAV